MITEIQKNIIRNCADDYETFYYIFKAFKETNQINNDDIIQNAIYLIQNGYLDFWRLNKGNKIKIDKPEYSEFEIYKNYNCNSFNEHLKKMGYGPHEFMATKKGINELH